MHSLRVGSTGVVTVSVGPSFHPRRVPLPGGAPVCGSAHRLLFGSFPVWGDDEEGQYRHSPAGLWVNRHLFLFLGGKSWEGGAGLSGESMFPFVRSCQRSPACCTVSRPLSVCLWPGLWTQETSFSAGLPARWSGRLCPSGGRAQKRGGPDPSAARQHHSASLGVHTWTKDEKRWPQPRRRQVRGRTRFNHSRRTEAACGQRSQTHRPALSPQGTCGTVGSGCGQMPACALGSSHHPSVRPGASVFRAAG